MLYAQFLILLFLFFTFTDLSCFTFKRKYIKHKHFQFFLFHLCKPIHYSRIDQSLFSDSPGNILLIHLRSRKQQPTLTPVKQETWSHCNKLTINRVKDVRKPRVGDRGVRCVCAEASGGVGPERAASWVSDLLSGGHSATHRRPQRYTVIV